MGLTDPGCIGQLSLPMLSGWDILVLGNEEPPARKSFQPLPDSVQPFALATNASQPETYLLSVGSAADFLVSFPQKRVSIFGIGSGVSQATIEHLLFDQLLPRILAHLGHLVLHAGAVNVRGKAVLFVGQTGRGKSTLCASLHRAGHRLLSDDAIIIEERGDSFFARALLPCLRLFPESVEHIFENKVNVSPMAHYSSKLRVDLEMAGDGRPAEIPVQALVFLQEPAVQGAISISPKSRQDACIGMVENSFSLDPADKALARGRLTQAGRLAIGVESLALSFPRDFAQLPQVRAAILDHLTAGERQSPGRSQAFAMG